MMVVAKGATVKIIDSKGTGYLKVEYSAWEKFTSAILNEGTLILEGVVVNGNNLYNAGAAAIVNNGTLELNNAVINVKKAADVIGNPAI